MQYSRRIILASLIAVALIFTAILSSRAAVERWGVFELTLAGPASQNPYLDTRLSAKFTQGAEQYVVSGFFDGSGSYKIRFSPPSPGEWSYETTGSLPELSGKRGSFTATLPSVGNYGPIQVFKTFYLRYADGTPYHQFGTTCYAWVHQTPELQEQTLKTLASSPFNKIRFCVFPKSYSYNKNEPGLFAFKKKADGKFDFDQPDPAFWHHFEKRILDLQKLGIEADIILWHPYDRWGFASMSDEEDDRYLRYCIARLGAYRSVWWSLANEFDFMTDQPPSGHKGNKQWEDWDRFFSILEKEDPYHRLRGNHNGSKWYDHTKPWVTHASIQTSDMQGGVRFRAQFQKPVIYDECKYEGNIRQGWGQLTAREMTQRFWLGTFSGCYVGHGETYMHPEDILWWAKGGVLRGESPNRIQWLKDFMAKAPAFDELQPLGDDKGRFVLGRPGEYYLLYCPSEKTCTIELAGNRPYKVDAIDPWEMREWPASTASPGVFTTAAPKGDLAYRFTPYQPGEKLRPEARPTASATEGIAPFKVDFFSSSAVADARWDFGDGSTSRERNPAHTFEKPGIYSVSLTVSDKDGGSAQNYLNIAVDRKFNDPIVRAGFADGDAPDLKLNGTVARKSDGSLHFPDGAPWGWVEAGEKALDDLRGLRSFTIMGWLKPESLKTGSGGNRIVFCLKGDHSGFDLVSQSDGRLRLAVNQWPDGVKNDSSPGKLEVGKWTFFAVTYTTTRTKENVQWFFSTPQPSPDAAAEITLDLKTTHLAGPVGTDVGPVTIGNFNATMRGSGLDRQFRGEIRELQIFGSRLGSRGALSLEETKKRMR